ncbi:DUF2924 domain-containing protein [Silicimonas algicola]|uniref:DUF2924 family protein n=1 Tax=Silicimonas algicola TaxID=1826607 RepID=A0A316G0X2_9RHOB|nr:DUF2924 domain-containing protein [Silicimonas algicola]PWK54604.1 hypothetical protein C8D95_11138 [Silicimonas algicola]
MTVAGLEQMDRAALSAAWSELFDTPVPKSLSQPLLRRFLARRLQEEAGASLSARHRKVLADAAAKPTRSVLPGGRLIREWNGVTHIVDVTEAGFVWNGETHRSLSQVAKAITGAHWSGPRFFCLRKGDR